MNVEKLEELDRKFELFKEKMGSTNHPFTRDTLDFLDKHRPNKAFQYWALVMLQRELDRAHTEDLASQIWDLEGRINELLGHGAAVIKERDELRAKANAVPEGFVLVPKEGIETWYLDEGEGLWMEDPDHWLCDLDAGEVQEVSRKEYMVTNSTPLFAVKPWDESDGDVGIWRLVDSRGEAEKLAANCEAMLEAQGQVG